MFERLKAFVFILIWIKWFSMVEELANYDKNLNDILKKCNLR